MFQPFHRLNSDLIYQPLPVAYQVKRIEGVASGALTVNIPFMESQERALSLRYIVASLQRLMQTTANTRQPFVSASYIGIEYCLRFFC